MEPGCRCIRTPETSDGVNEGRTLPTYVAPSASSASVLLRFRLDTHVFALGAADVVEVVRAVAIAPLPRAPSVIEGVVDVRGVVVPVLDVRARFHLAAAPLAASQHFLLARAGRRVVALRVDEALDVVRAPVEAVDEHPQGLEGLEHLKGVARLADGVVAIQDLDRFLSLDEEIRLDRALADAAPEATAPAGPSKGPR
jgi:purine-binding chemotaxis protein CheW